MSEYPNEGVRIQIARVDLASSRQEMIARQYGYDRLPRDDFVDDIGLALDTREAEVDLSSLHGLGNVWGEVASHSKVDVLQLAPEDVRDVRQPHHFLSH